jgi:hypothetical protein
VSRWSIRLLLCFGALLSAGPALARGDDGDRQERRLELRRQIEAERDRWRADPRRGGPGQGGRGYQAPMRPGHEPGHGPRLSPDERRELRRELREQRR